MIHLRGRLGFPWNNRYMRDLDDEMPLHAFSVEETLFLTLFVWFVSFCGKIGPKSFAWKKSPL